MAKRARPSVEDAEIAAADNERRMRNFLREYGYRPGASDAPAGLPKIAIDEIAGNLEARARMRAYIDLTDKIRRRLDAGFYYDPDDADTRRDSEMLSRHQWRALSYLGVRGEDGVFRGRLPSDWDVERMKSAYEDAIGHLPGPARVSIDKFLFGSTPTGRTGLETMVNYHRSKLETSLPAAGGAGVGAAAARH